MSTSDITATSTDQVAPVEAAAAPEELSAESLIEEVSIDGMCGVY